MEPDDDGADVQVRVLQHTLQEVAFGSASNGNDQVDCCVICLDAITEACEARPCQHGNFDFVCLINWLEQQPKCPLCKSAVTEVRYKFEEPDRGRWRTYKICATASSDSTAASRGTLLPPRRSWPSRRQQREAHTFTQDEAIIRRRQIYRHGLYSMHVGTNRNTRYRELTPQLFEQDPDLVSRTRMWLRRELKVFEFLHTPTDAQDSDDIMTQRRANNAEFLLEYIIAILKTVDMQGSQGQAEDMLQEFLGREHTRLLLHELKSFLRSPSISLQAWDRTVQYPSVSSIKRRSNSPGTRTRSDLDSWSSEVRGGDFYRPRYSGTDRHVGSARGPRPGPVH
ncbi:hypothetical protein PFICI_14428 [Pestalotiopsis fici W106-1]|uniref:RING-type E3 ubiquitin transferase n=1 Tax=Pestalotiopsis fici (strain W106-1 / CGMCC3.15140) TaxID=1229662 RepID=W3WK00_PESFW|nr:uncharacterized protein PFICI_14428 [Pestalotiopsis fici W106-1]ETS73482.1 hypothetical protein PFICI_14428 [Pestalotiopsis fici W106-1]